MLKLFQSMLVVLVLLSSCAKKDALAPEESRRLAKVHVKEIQNAGQDEVLSFSGTLEADKMVIQSFAVSGTILSIQVEEGSEVRVGQLLATLDATSYESSLKIAEAGLMEAQDAFNRLSQLYGKGSLPERDLIQAKAALQQAEANKTSASKQLSDTQLRAAISGIISAKDLEVGSNAGPGIPAFSIVKTDKMYATVAIPEVEIGKVVVGNEAIVSVPTIAGEFRGGVSIINPVADAVSKTYTVKVKLDNPEGRLLPGMISTNRINTGKTVRNLSVPTKAIVRDADDITYVFVLKNENKVRRQRVSIGGLSKNEVIVSSGLRSGDKIVVEGQTKLKDGQLVTTI